MTNRYSIPFNRSYLVGKYISSAYLLASGLQFTPAISPAEKVLPARLNLEIIRRLQEAVAPAIFTPPAVYDGRKNMFAPRLLPFEEGRPSQEVRNVHFTVLLPSQLWV